MIKAIVTADEKTRRFEFPVNRERDYYSELKDMGVLMPFWAVKVSNAERAFPKVTLISDSDFGAHLVKLFDGYTLGDVNEMTEAILKAHEDIRTELEQNIIYDQYTCPEEVYESIHDMTYVIGKLSETYYFPLSGEIYDPEYGDTCSVGNYMLIDNSDLISERLDDYLGAGENMAGYFYGAGKEKLSWRIGNSRKSRVLYTEKSRQD